MIDQTINFTQQQARDSNRFKLQALDTDPKGIQENNFSKNLRGAYTREMFFIIEEAK